MPGDVRFLGPFVAAGVFGPTEVHLAATVARLRERQRAATASATTGGAVEGAVESSGGAPSADELVLLAVAVAARAPRSGHVCVELDAVPQLVVDGRFGRRVGAGVEALAWPDPLVWAEALASSDVVAEPSDADSTPLRPLVWDGRRLYLHRLWVDERSAAQELRRRADAPPAQAPEEHLVDAALDAAFGPAADGDDRQRRAARSALEGSLTVLVGGPGTGKTRTVARMLAAALIVDADSAPTSQGASGLQVALAAPTGKAAARMTAAVRSALFELEQEGAVEAPVLDHLRSVDAVTVHRLLGRSRGGGFRHHAGAPLPYDLVVVDETSMVDLPLMARLLEALRPSSHLVLVGDPDQLASVEAGTVLADVAAGGALAGRVVTLRTTHRFEADSGIAALASAIRSGDVEATLALLDSGRSDVSWVRPNATSMVAAVEAQVIDAAVSVSAAALDGDPVGALAAGRSLKVLAAMRLGRFGLYDWSRRIEEGVAGRLSELRVGQHWYAGRPVMVVANDPLLGVANGDTGVAIARGDQLLVALDSGAATSTVPAVRLDRVETWWAMTIHKSQGSEFDRVVVSLPESDSPVLTRELLYTAVTRARDEVVVVADEATVRRAVRRPVARASGLQDRLLTN